MTRNLTEIISLPNEEFRFTLESINSAFGISAATLNRLLKYPSRSQHVLLEQLRFFS